MGKKENVSEGQVKKGSIYMAVLINTRCMCGVSREGLDEGGGDGDGGEIGGRGR